MNNESNQTFGAFALGLDIETKNEVKDQIRVKRQKVKSKTKNTKQKFLIGFKHKESTVYEYKINSDLGCQLFREIATFEENKDLDIITIELDFDHYFAFTKIVDGCKLHESIICDLIPTKHFIWHTQFVINLEINQKKHAINDYILINTKNIALCACGLIDFINEGNINRIQRRLDMLYHDFGYFGNENMLNQLYEMSKYVILAANVVHQAKCILECKEEKLSILRNKSFYERRIAFPYKFTVFDDEILKIENYKKYFGNKAIRNMEAIMADIIAERMKSSSCVIL